LPTLRAGRRLQEHHSVLQVPGGGSGGGAAIRMSRVRSFPPTEAVHWALYPVLSHVQGVRAHRAHGVGRPVPTVPSAFRGPRGEAAVPGVRPDGLHPGRNRVVWPVFSRPEPAARTQAVHRLWRTAAQGRRRHVLEVLAA
jgi:hypothetical protein